MKANLRIIIVLCVVIAYSCRASSQQMPKNGISFSVDFIHSVSKAFNLHQTMRSSTYDVSPGFTLSYDRIIKDRFFIRAGVGYYYIVNHMNFPGEFPDIDHSMNRIGELHIDAVPLGLDVGIIHSFNDQWSLSFYLGMNSYLLYSPIPSAYTLDLNNYFHTVGEEIITRVISATDLYTTDFIHSYNVGHSIAYRLSRSSRMSIYMDNHLRVGFRPYMNFGMVVFSGTPQGNVNFWNAAGSILSSLFFTSIGIRYGF